MSIIKELKIKLASYQGESQFSTLLHPYVIFSKGFRKFAHMADGSWVMKDLCVSLFPIIEARGLKPNQQTLYTGRLYHYLETYQPPVGLVPLWVQFCLFDCQVGESGPLIYEAIPGDELESTGHFDFNIAWDGEYLISSLPTEFPFPVPN